MQPSPAFPRPKLLLALAVGVAAAAFAVGGAGGYAWYENRKAEAAIQGQQQLATQLQQTRAQIDQLSTKVSELAARPAPEAVAPPPVAQPPVAVKPATPRGPSESQPLKKMQSQLDHQGRAIDQQNKAIADTQSQLDTTRGDLSSTRTELSGSIARTHDELVLLQKIGERNYYEFDIAKSKSFQHQGPLGVRLRKANSKHQYADLDLIVEDQTVTQKHVNLYQPTMFFTPDSPQPAELVINSISKDRIHGYVSAPKYRQSQLASAAGGNASSSSQTATSQPTPQPQPRQSLPQPQ
jgi:uncharacterized membrane-anchored protein YhcB (DUF1043 family)